MPETIRVLVFRVGQPASVEEIENSLDAQQRIVGGFIELAHLTLYSDLQVICNEEGKLNGLPANRAFHNDVLVGDFFVTHINDEGENDDLTDSDITEALTFFYGKEL